MLAIKDLTVATIEKKIILKNISLECDQGTIHAIMGPNGSGKSTLAHVIAGNPELCVLNGSITYGGRDISHISPHERARNGLFLSFQQPPAIAGLKVFTFLKEIYQAISQEQIEVELLHAVVLDYCRQLKINASFLERFCHEGFSGGEKKRFELLQVLLLKPRGIILDEIDSGLDIDGLKLIADVLAQVRRHNPATFIVIITHYQRVLQYIKPDFVHVLVDGTIVQSGSFEVVHHLEQRGYDDYRATNAT